MKGNSKGVEFNDRLLAGQVRSLGLTHLQKILSEDYPDKGFQKEMLLKIGSALLPRLNEHTGEGGGPIKLEGLKIKIQK